MLIFRDFPSLGLIGLGIHVVTRYILQTNIKAKKSKRGIQQALNEGYLK